MWVFFSLVTFISTLRAGSLAEHGPLLFLEEWLASKPQRPACLNQCWVGAHLHTWLSHGSWGSELRSPHLDSKDFHTDPTPALASFKDQTSCIFVTVFLRAMSDMSLYSKFSFLI